ncbi:hypothetical protein [Okeania sp. SIO2B3]|uniref:hypothetical protein n=1 Tax=Okeania sp. SIO2B3 TaxID=2607784 RepID=UPI0013BEE0BB|nr:hypothetical protein [Okeania sp. SIO2B3]NET40589.1 hypothetical protein [Okeania sp. SIO2B3]
MNKNLEKIKLLTRSLSKPEIELLIISLKDLLLEPQPEAAIATSSTSDKCKSRWTEIKYIKGHPYLYERRKEVVSSPTEKTEIVTRSKYLGKV